MNRDDARVDVVTVASDEVLQGMQRLPPKLSSSAPPLTWEQLEEIVGSDSTTLFIARKRFKGFTVFEKPPEWWSARPASTLGIFAADQALPPAVAELVREASVDGANQ